MSTTWCTFNDWDFCSMCDNISSEYFSDNSIISNSRGWTVCRDDEANDCFNENYGYGLYKFSNSSDEQYFFIDFRDSDYWYTYPSNPPDSSDDICISFNYNSGDPKFEYYIGEGIVREEISNKEILQVRDIFSRSGTQKTNGFQEFWSNCLISINDNDHPRLIWNSHPSPNQYTHFKIYRGWSSSPVDPATIQNYNLIVTLSKTVFEYTDTDVIIDVENPAQFFWYYIVGYNSFTTNESSSSNYVLAEGDIYKLLPPPKTA